MRKIKHILKVFSIMMIVTIISTQVLTVNAAEVEDAQAGEDAGVEAEDIESGEVAAAEQEDAEGEDEAAETVDLNGTYNATLGIQTCTNLWIYRFGYYSADINDTYGTDRFAVLTSGSESSGNLVEYAGTFNDAVIQGNGIYTVSLTNADFAGEMSVSQLHFATDIPLNDVIKFTDIKVKINNRTVMTFDEGYVEDDVQFLDGGIVILAFNNWRNTLKQIVQDQGLYIEGSGIELLRGNGNDNIEITFTVSGFAYDKAEEVVEEEEVQVAEDINKAEEADETAAEETEDTEDTEDAPETADTDDKEKDSSLLFYIGIPLVIIIIAASVLLSKKKKA